MAGGAYLSKQESDFLHAVREELQIFLQTNEMKRVLLFPPLPSRFRFLIHQLSLDYHNLSTYSVGEGCTRRGVLCHSDLKLPDSNGCSYNQAHGTPREKVNKDRRSQESKNNKIKERRPDKAIYVPPVAREKLCMDRPNLEESTEEFISENTKEQRVSDQGPKVDVLLESEPPRWPAAWERTVSFWLSCDLNDEEIEDCTSKANLPTSDPVQEKDIDEDLVSEIKAKLCDGDITIQNTHSDFHTFLNIWLNPEEFGHVIEIYDFPAMLKSEDLHDAFLDYSEGGMKIKWVDNTHALGIFSSHLAATQALSIKHPILKTRLLIDGSDKSKWKASRHAEFLLPVKERPRTDAVVAHRMVSRGLGLKGNPEKHYS